MDNKLTEYILKHSKKRDKELAVGQCMEIFSATVPLNMKFSCNNCF